MRRLSPAPGRAVAGLFAVVLACAVAVLGLAPPAAAHGTLAMSTPAEGATVDRPLTAVELYFTEQVAGNAYFTVTAPGGGRVDNGWAHGSPKPLAQPVREYFLVDGKFEPREYATGFPAVVTVAHLPAVGEYSVTYLSVASDGEAVRGTMKFRYTGPVTAAPQGWQPPTNQPDPALVAAADQHADAGHGSGGQSAAAPPPVASPVSSAPPAPAAAPTARTDDGGPGWLAWSGWLVAAAAAAGVVGWRRRTAPAGRTTGRPRGPAGTARPRGGGTRAGGGTGAAGARSGGKGRSTTLAAARKRGAPVTARTAAPAGEPDASARTATVDEPPPAAGSSPPSGADDGPPGRRLSDVRLALVVGGVVVALVAGFGLGRVGAANGSTAAGTPTPPAATSGPAAGAAVGAGHQHAAGAGAHTHPGDGGADQTQPAGTTVSAAGYTLEPQRRSQPAGAGVDYRFRIVGADRQAATRFTVVHDKPLHLIVVGRDLSGYQHLHPTMAADGTWSVPLRLARAGTYRVYADFSVTTAEGSALPLVLGVDHHVPGAHAPAELPPPQPQARTGPFTVALDGTPTVGVSVPLLFRVGRTGPAGPVPLERYLGAYGHLVVVREGDLGYVHVHPEPELVDGAVKVWLTAPSAGRYRAFFDFQVDGTVHTASYTLDLS
ncbi:copper resistance protein CopC [Micromonospora sp. PLK6-60]|uniref:copper resistance CopC family protein n=1 Tax=Micromonospora sp. PLK6-60 TaxID=2873383 RepID=UPI001CA7446D|nr:copper resistance protein CopC [Micromonospora sp. PLK6-60]MBY8870681.1 copper resistance protein CopC [Micromonospora sp. PLK6-60]